MGRDMRRGVAGRGRGIEVRGRGLGERMGMRTGKRGGVGGSWWM